MKDSTSSADPVDTNKDAAESSQPEAAPAHRPLSEDAGLEVEALSAMVGALPKENRIDKTRKTEG